MSTQDTDEATIDARMRECRRWRDEEADTTLSIRATKRDGSPRITGIPVKLRRVEVDTDGQSQISVEATEPVTSIFEPEPRALVRAAKLLQRFMGTQPADTEALRELRQEAADAFEGAELENALTSFDCMDDYYGD